MSPRHRIVQLALPAVLGILLSGCHPGPVINTSPLHVGGTIAGVVTGTKGTVALEGRKVTAVEVASGARYDATTSVSGGYTIKVPEGRYRIELETRAGETLTRKPDDTRVTNGDLDSGRDFEVTVAAAPD